MRRRHSSTMLLLCLVAAACVPAPVATPAIRPQGAATAAFPPAGATWRVRVTERGLFRETVQDLEIQAVPTAFDKQ